MNDVSCAVGASRVLRDRISRVIRAAGCRIPEAASGFQCSMNDNSGCGAARECEAKRVRDGEMNDRDRRHARKARDCEAVPENDP